MEALGAGRIDNVAISEITPPFGCDSEPTDSAVRLRGDARRSAPGESRVHRVTIVIPDAGRFEKGASTRKTALP